MKLTWSTSSWEDYLYWQKVDKKIVKRINELIKSCMRTPFEGIGKPEALKGDLQGYWSRRITSEHRLVYKYEKERDESIKEELYQNYLAHFKYINNWDLVDVTCPKIIGRHLFERDRSILYTWAKSDNLWIKRISMITNWWFIRKGDLREVYKLSVILLHDEHDLIHKAVGWMLREAWKKDSKQTEAFLKKYYKQMPPLLPA